MDTEYVCRHQWATLPLNYEDDYMQSELEKSTSEKWCTVRSNLNYAISNLGRVEMAEMISQLTDIFQQPLTPKSAGQIIALILLGGVMLYILCSVWFGAVLR